MLTSIRTKTSVTFALLFLLFPGTWTASQNPQQQDQAASGEVRVPNRPAAPLFQGQQGKQRTEIHFDSATGMVAMKLLVQDPNGYFIPNLRSENFAVYENGVRQPDINVSLERAPASIGLLLEFANLMPGLGKLLGPDISEAAHKFIRELGTDDSVTVWKYGDKVEKLGDSTQGRDMLDTGVLTLDTPGASEANLYDALLYVVQTMQPKPGRKAIVLISDGIDSYSKASYENVVAAVEKSNIPIYVISMTKIASQYLEAHQGEGPLVRIDWNKMENNLEEIARASGGRVYLPTEALDLSTTYDDLMENLKVRYVIKYRSTTTGDSPRTVRVELVNPQTGGPLRIIGKDGHPIRAMVIAQDSYTPSLAGKGTNGRTVHK